MIKFSANLGFLWRDMPLPMAIQRAKSAGFDAVECHFPYETDPEVVKIALEKAGLPMVGLNTVPGGADQFGRAALPDQSDQAQADIEQGIRYGAAIGAKNLHVMAGLTLGPMACQTFRDNLTFAADLAAEHDMQILIEPLNSYDNPGYFLNSSDQAIRIIQAVDRPNLKLMFDCYHIQMIEGDLTRKLQTLMPYIGHIQIASTPNRNEPDKGEIAYERLIPAIYEMGYTGYIGAEYQPSGFTVEEGLDWLSMIGRSEAALVF